MRTMAIALCALVLAGCGITDEEVWESRMEARIRVVLPVGWELEPAGADGGFLREWELARRTARRAVHAACGLNVARLEEGKEWDMELMAGGPDEAECRHRYGYLFG